MEDILEKARELGKMLANSPAFRAFQKARQVLRENAEAKKLSDDLNRQAQKIADLEAALKPVEPEDKREFQRLQEAASSNPIIQEFVRAQADYMDLMRRVNETIQEEMGVEPEST